jgi:hypothetical protein
VFAQLPTPELTSLARVEILEFVSDPRMSAYCEFAASRAAEVTGSAFLTSPAILTPPAIPSPDHGTLPAGPQPMPAAAATGPQPVRSDAGLGPDVSRTSPEPSLGPVRTSPEPGLPGRPPLPRPAVAHGFIGSWEPAESATSRPPRPSRHLGDPAGPQAGSAARAGAASAVAPARFAAVPASSAVPAAPAVPVASAAPVAKVPASSAVAPAGTTPGSQPPVPRQPAPATGRAKPRAARRFRGSRLLTASVAATILTAAITFVGLRGMHAPRPSDPAAATASQSGAATIQAGGGTNVAAPVEAPAPGSGKTTPPSTRGTAAQAESLAVTATQPVATDTLRLASSRSRPSHRPDAKVSAVSSPSASPSQSGPAKAIGTLTMAPGQLDLGTGTVGHLTLTAADGPVSWSASTTSGRLTLSSNQGILQAGQSVTLTVTVNRNAGHGGNASVVVDWNPVTPGAPAVPAAAPTSSQAVQVNWAADPQPSPSPSASGGASSSAPPSAAPSSVVGQ